MTVKPRQKTRADLRRSLLEGIRVLTAEEVLTGSGHLSARLGEDRFLINPRYAGVLADAQDLCEVDLAGKRVTGTDPIPLETSIHSVIYRRRPDVHSVLHCHARFAVLMTLCEEGLIPFNREAASFAGGAPIFADSSGIHNDPLAERMADALGQHAVVLLKGHGIVVVGPNIEATCVTAIRLEKACMDQLLLMSFMKPKPLADNKPFMEGPRAEHPYRFWPFLLHKHGIRPKKEIKAMAKSMLHILWPDER